MREAEAAAAGEELAVGSLSPLASVSATRAVLERHGLATKKSLGQNFLINDDVLRKIIELSQTGPEDVVLEVGPGIGTLTVALLKNARRVVSIERDPDLWGVLPETLDPWAGKFGLIRKDALDVARDDIAAAARPCAFPGKFVANLPYAVAATLVLDFFQRFPELGSATVMVQKEVADRMSATPGTKNYGAYTVKLGLYAAPSGRFPVPPGNFFPPPHVDSAVIRLDRAMPDALAQTARELAQEAGSCEEGEGGTGRAGDPGNARDAASAGGSEAVAVMTDRLLRATCTMADAAFANRRKTLSNSCRTYFSGRGEDGARIAGRLPQLFSDAGIDPKRRGETLDQAEFVAMGRALLQMADAE